jgi:hypothetical protein
MKINIIHPEDIPRFDQSYFPHKSMVLKCRERLGRDPTHRVGSKESQQLARVQSTGIGFPHGA